MKIPCMFLALLCSSLVAAEPADLTKAREAYQQASERALTPVKAAYWKELTRMIDDYTRLGKLEEAIAVKNELAKLTGGLATPMPVAAGRNAADIAQFRARFLGRTFVTGGGTVFTFNTDGTGKQSWREGSESFKWEILDDEVEHNVLAPRRTRLRDGVFGPGQKQ